MGKNLRKYGKSPFNVAVIHGGPGAAGEMALIAKELSSECGILEPFQTATSLEGQVRELKTVIDEVGNPPVILIGFSWGAWLSFTVAAAYPSVVKKLILIGSGPFEKKYAENILETRLSRLNKKDQGEVFSLINQLIDPTIKEKNKSLARLGKIFFRTDAWDPLPLDKDGVEVQYRIYRGVWRDAEEMRRTGRLLEMRNQIRCPVVAIHGDFDPHPAEGVQKPLSDMIKNFRFILLKKCGHRPWIERLARDKFFEILTKELD